MVPAGSLESAASPPATPTSLAATRAPNACDRLGAELKSARESEKLASAKLETSSRKVEESSKAVEDLRMQLNPLQATEKKLIAQVSAEKSKAQEFERKMNDLQNIADQKTKDSATAEKRMDELKKVAEQKTQEAAEAEAGAKGLKRQVIKKVRM